MALDPRLNKLSTEDLTTLKGKVDEILKSRQRTELRRGALVSFENSRNGERVFMTVDRINQKSVSGTAVDAKTGMPTRQSWRVSPSLLRTEVHAPWLPKPEPKVVAPTGSDRPKSAMPTF